jgi:hypothetical protein
MSLDQVSASPRADIVNPPTLILLEKLTFGAMTPKDELRSLASPLETETKKLKDVISMSKEFFEALDGSFDLLDFKKSS